MIIQQADNVKLVYNFRFLVPFLGIMDFIKKTSISITTAVVIILAGIIVFPPVLGWFISGINFIVVQTQQTIPLPGWLLNILQSFVANILFLLIGGFVVFALIKRSSTYAICGTYNAKDLTSGEEKDWGDLFIKYDFGKFLKQGTPLKIENKHGDITLYGEGVLIKDHIIGYYTEISKLQRRRMGSFFMTMDGEGDKWTGESLFMDPDTREVARGKILWKKK